MEIGIAVLSLMTALVAGVSILRPLVQPEIDGQREMLDEEFRNLLDQKERCVQVLRDLELDFGTGKIEPEDHEQMKRTILSEMAAVLKKLDQFRDDK